MSEVIRDFIKGHAQMSEQQAFEAFLRQERIRAWVGDDPQRREKIHREFTRIWAAEHGRPAPVVQVHTPPPATTQVPVQRARAGPARAEGGIETGHRKLNLLCPACDQTDVWTRGHLIECRRCGRVYDNMLDLVPVQPVGPFTYVFGEGAGGVATAVGLAALLLVIYAVFRYGR